jgi:hypothetical protein
VKNAGIFGAVLFLSACSTLGSGSQLQNCPIRFTARSDLPEGIGLRGPVRLRAGGQVIQLDVVARSTADGIVIVGISEYGVRAFAVKQQDRSIEVANAVSREFAHVARWTADALHRGIWLNPPENGRSGPVVSWAWEDEQVTESTQVGDRRREFSRSGDSRLVIVRYKEQAVEIDNPWCGYQAVLSVVDEVPDQGSVDE